MSLFPLTVEVDDTYISLLSGADAVEKIRKRHVVGYRTLQGEPRLYGNWGGGPALESATMVQDDYPDPPSDIDTSQIAETPAVQYVVRLFLRNRKQFDIPMGLVSNQAGWVNTEAGAAQAIADLTGGGVATINMNTAMFDAVEMSGGGVPSVIGYYFRMTNNPSWWEPDGRAWGRGTRYIADDSAGAYFGVGYVLSDSVSGDWPTTPSYPAEPWDADWTLGGLDSTASQPSLADMNTDFGLGLTGPEVPCDEPVNAVVVTGAANANANGVYFWNGDTGQDGTRIYDSVMDPDFVLFLGGADNPGTDANTWYVLNFPLVIQYTSETALSLPTNPWDVDPTYPQTAGGGGSIEVNRATVSDLLSILNSGLSCP